jgi:hypothetical protein
MIRMWENKLPSDTFKKIKNNKNYFKRGWH